MSLYDLDSNRIFHVTVLSCQYHVIHPYAVKLRYLTFLTYLHRFKFHSVGDVPGV
jgi:hypothetical protein